MKIYLDSVGCRLNQAEIESFARQLICSGHQLVRTPEIADMVIINTCTVTSAADADSRQKIRVAAQNGDRKVIVTGCWSTLNPQMASAFPGVVEVIPNTHKDQLVHQILGVPPQRFELEPLERHPVPGKRFRTRAFVKVQDGCDNRCTFCITTLARGPSRSRSIKNILFDIQSVTHNNLKQGNPSAALEIVLTGVHLGAWGHDRSPRLHLSDLVRAILQDTDFPRLRLSSLEPWDLDDDFFTLWQDPRLCRHLHLPLQSGSRKILRRMARKTTPEEYKALVNLARDNIPGIAITTDVITGFPGETEDEFAESLSFVESMNFAGGHVFTYSNRPGTAAAKMPDQVRKQVKKGRNAKMRTVLSESQKTFQSNFIGKELPVLWESATPNGNSGWKLSGLTDNYLRVLANSKERLWNQISPVYLIDLVKHGLFGKIKEK